MNWNTRITDMLKIQYPILQGGLAYLAYAELAAAVSNAGGFGQITAMSLPDAQALRREIRRARVLTDKPFGVNFSIGMHRVTNFRLFRLPWKKKYLRLRLQAAIQMGTRFIATRECRDASNVYKNALLEVGGADTVVLKRSIGQPARALWSPFTEKILQREQATQGHEAITNEISGKANKRLIHDSSMEEGFGWK